jgi:putative oxidoreductase
MHVIPGPELSFAVRGAPTPQGHRASTWTICHGTLRPALAHNNTLANSVSSNPMSSGIRSLHKGSTSMNTATWAFQGLLAVLFLMLGSLHAFAPMAKLIARVPALASLAPRFVRFIGVCEILGAIGLIAPAATGILPWLTPVAACCLAALMVCAIFFHVSRREYREVVRNVVIFAIVLVIALGRWKLVA